MSPGKPSIARGIVKGSHKWVDIHSVKGVSPKEYTTQLTTLKQNGYTLVAADPAQGAIPIDELPIDKPIAFIFGTENFGLSDIALQAADYKTFIPMFGFTESFNVSVSAAICLRSVMNRLRESHIDWQLSSLEQKRLLGKWLIVGVNRPMIHLKQVVKREIF
jgi:tRNA (guanosine-2'-O-)-methyltransferase